MSLKQSRTVFPESQYTLGFREYCIMIIKASFLFQFLSLRSLTILNLLIEDKLILPILEINLELSK